MAIVPTGIYLSTQVQVETMLNIYIYLLLCYLRVKSGKRGRMGGAFFRKCHGIRTSKTQKVPTTFLHFYTSDSGGLFGTDFRQKVLLLRHGVCFNVGR